VPAQRGELLAPPQTNHAAEVGALQAMARRMIAAQRTPAAVCDDDERPGAVGCEFDFDVGGLVRCEIGIPPRESQARGR
jgi:hypothetical protein